MFIVLIPEKTNQAFLKEAIHQSEQRRQRYIGLQG
jgi:hypothetical protein